MEGHVEHDRFVELVRATKDEWSPTDREDELGIECDEEEGGQE